MRYVVLSIEDNDTAESFANDLLTASTRGMPFVPQEADVIGMFAVPTQYCDPTDGHRGKKTQAAWTRGKKYGWWVCGACKKPTKAWARNMNALMSSARNLLNGTDDIMGAAMPTKVTKDS